MQEQVILVDTSDNIIGYEEKLKAHQLGLLHRAFSVFVFDLAGNMLLQQRAMNKYHSPGLWTNTCCSHPRAGEELTAAASRRMQEEMGIAIQPQPLFSFIYKVNFANGLTEHEYDHVLAARWQGQPQPNPAEVMAWKWERPEVTLQDVKQHPLKYTYWFSALLERIIGIMEQDNFPAQT